MPYVYRHIRKDKNQPFYIGIGLSDENFHRAYAKAKRNSYWKNIVSLTEYDVQILFSDVSKEFALEKERELIQLYKRVEDGGTLCNVTMGGEGTVGRKPSNIRKTYAKNIDGEVFSFDSTSEAALFTGCNNISHLISKRSITNDGWVFGYSESELHEPRRKRMNGLHDRHSKKSVRLTNGIETINFASYTEAAKHVGVFTNHIGDLVRGKLNYAKGWKLLKTET